MHSGQWHTSFMERSTNQTSNETRVGLGVFPGMTGAAEFLHVYAYGNLTTVLVEDEDREGFRAYTARSVVLSGLQTIFCDDPAFNLRWSEEQKHDEWGEQAYEEYLMALGQY